MAGDAKPRKKMSNKLFAGIWGTVLAVFAIALIVGNVVAHMYSTIINVALGQNTQKIENLDESGASDYFKSDYESEEALYEHETELSQNMVGEGAVLLKNEDSALPMAGTEKVSIFGVGSTGFLYGGGGSGAIDTTNVTSLKDALEKQGFAVNPTLWSMYETAAPKLLKEIAPSEYSADVEASFGEYGDAAIVVISRTAQEAYDIEAEVLMLTEEEVQMIDYVNGKFDKIIVLLNTANPIECGFAEAYENIKALMWVGYAGQTGIDAIPQILAGERNPSGRLVDTYAYSVLSSPAAQIFGSGQVANGVNDVGAKNQYTVYGENIYVGYRYYETRYEDTVLGQGNADSDAGNYEKGAWNYTDTVQYPFGYGLSYTTFEYSDFSLADNGDSFTAEVTVNNTGDAAGKDVVEIYFQSPYTQYDIDNKIEKASVELCGFAKTAEIPAGGSETVSIEIPKETLRTYDAYGARTYIVDAGTYYFTAAADAHRAVNNILAAKGYTTENGMDADGDAAMTGTYEQAELDTTTFAIDADTGVTIENQFDTGSICHYDDSYVYLTRNDWKGTWPEFYGEANEKGKYSITASDELFADSQQNLYQDDPNAVMPVTGSGEDLKLISMRGKAYDDPGWEAILDCLTVNEMMEMVRNGGWNTAQLVSVSKPVSRDQDGPAGISDTLVHSNLGCMGYPNQEVLAAAWNTELSYDFGLCIGEDGLKAGVHGWYAPGSGTHRSPLGGRNFEYYSEDGYLAGKICAKTVEAAQSKGLYCYLKHIVLNDQEERRYGIATFVTEQALRELYLTPFEIAVKEADCHGMMAAFNGIGGIWCGANKGLITNVLTNEFGFRGIVVTDYASANSGYMWIDMGLQAGTDLWLNTDTTVYNIEGVENNPTLVTALRNSAHDILYTVVNSSAMNGFSEETVIKSVLPPWKIWLYIFDAVMAVVIAGCAFLIARRCKNNK